MREENKNWCNISNFNPIVQMHLNQFNELLTIRLDDFYKWEGWKTLPYYINKEDKFNYLINIYI